MIKRMVAIRSFLAVLMTAGLLTPGRADDVADMAGIRRIQGRVDRPVFFVGGLEPSLQAGGIKASAGSRPLEVGSVEPEPHPPTDFLVLIDVSKSNKAPNDDIATFTNILIGWMGNNDRMEIATFGDAPFETRVLLTSDTQRLGNSLRAIKATADCTKLYQALIRAAQRLHSADLAPTASGRNAALLVLSDGDDDDGSLPGAGGKCNRGPPPYLIQAANDVAQAGVPLLFIDTSSDPKEPCKTPLATQIVSRGDNSERFGGRCVSLSKATDAVRALTGVTRIEAACRDCPNGSQTYALDIRTRSGNHLYLTREARLESAPPPPKPANPEISPVKPEQPWSLPLVGGLALALLVGLGCLMAFLRSRRKRSPETDVVIENSSYPEPILQPPPEPAPSAPPNAEFVQLGHYGREQRFPVAITEQPMSLGRGDGCDIVLARDSAVADIQCEFVRNEGEVLVRNIGHEGSLILDGAGVPAGAGWRLLRHGDVLRVGSTELRFSDFERT